MRRWTGDFRASPARCLSRRRSGKWRRRQALPDLRGRRERRGDAREREGGGGDGAVVRKGNMEMRHHAFGERAQAGRPSREVRRRPMRERWRARRQTQGSNAEKAWQDSERRFFSLEHLLTFF